MKVQIITKDNIVLIDNKSIEIDCSQFTFRFCEVNEDKKWIENIPFAGPEDLEDWTKVLSFIELAKASLIEPEIDVIDSSIVPTSIKRRQARLYLLDLDLLTQVETLIATNQAWQIEYEADIFERSNPIVNILQEQLNLTTEQVDTMFVEASKL